MTSKLRPDDVRDRVTAGKLNREITIRRFTSTTHPGTGQPQKTWGDLVTVWASWRRASARETLAASEIGGQVTDVFECRWSATLATVTVKDKVLYQGKTYDLSEVTEIGRRKGVMLRGTARAE